MTISKVLKSNIWLLFLTVNHSGKDPTKGARGSTVLIDAVDTEINVSSKNEILKMKCWKQRDDQKFGPLTLSF